MIIPRESAWFVLNELGRMNSVELVDMNPEEASMSRPYYPMIRRIEDAIGKLIHIESEMAAYSIKNIKCRDTDEFLRGLGNVKLQESSEDRFFETIEHLLDEKYSRLQDRIRNMEMLKHRKNELHDHIVAL